MITFQNINWRYSTAIINAKDIRVCLDNYYRKNGRLPDSAESSNESFRELFRAGVCRDEKPFHVLYPSAIPMMQGDDDYSEGNILEPGSCGFSYWTHRDGKGFDIEQVPADTPVASTCMFKQSPFVSLKNAHLEQHHLGNYAVVLRVDGSAKIYETDKNGYLIPPKENKNEFHTIPTRVTFPEGTVTAKRYQKIREAKQRAN